MKTGNEINSTRYIDIKGRNTRERGQSIKRELTSQLADLLMDKFNREPF